ncbi:hypothetical protein PHMEG_00014490 [Phytophthora megakarya]|uniref:Replication protein A OB domain-containing protein n=1 Tax=Phytophthora megakarya TaxID=4795 RepID=A0A225W5R6_9STRA|nr:hypothetical protein PHMEG_00014490 [Phytophthora megakarya]
MAPAADNADTPSLPPVAPKNKAPGPTAESASSGVPDQSNGTETLTVHPAELSVPSSSLASPAKQKNTESTEAAASTETSPVKQSEKKTDLPIPTYAVKELTPQLTEPWAFVCRIISRSPIREYNSLRGAGRLCEIYVADSQGDYIRVTIFNEAIDKFHATLVPGTTHVFSTGRIKLATFGSAVAAYEITLGTNAGIEPVTDGQLLSTEPRLDFTTFDKLEKLTTGDTITLAGIVHATGPMKRIMTIKRGLERREFALVDDTSFKVICTSWGLLARESGNDFEGQPLIIIGAQITDYNGARSVNIGVNAIVLYDPAIVRSGQLRDWYARLQPNQAFTVVG